MDDKHKKDQDACPDVETLKADLRKRFENLLAFCCDRRSERSQFQRFEKDLFQRVFELARLLVVLFLTVPVLSPASEARPSLWLARSNTLEVFTVMSVWGDVGRTLLAPSWIVPLFWIVVGPL